MKIVNILDFSLFYDTISLISLYPTVSSLQGCGSGSELGSAICMDQYSNEFFDPDLFGYRS
jgi:hypothetical protein